LKKGIIMAKLPLAFEKFNYISKALGNLTLEKFISIANTEILAVTLYRIIDI
jgi:hypothetical protein